MNKFIFIVLLVLSVFLLIIWQIPAIALQNWIIDVYHLDSQQTHKLKESILSPSSWLLLQVFISIFLAIVLFLIVVFQEKISLATKIFLHLLQNQSKTFLKAFQNLSKTEKITFFFTLCLLNGYTLYNLHHKIPHIDEAFSYVHFSSKGFLVSALYYPNPNNHIFYNLIASFFDIFISNKTWAMRLPSFLSFLALQVLLFRYFLSHFSFVNALLGLLVFSLFSPIQAYAIMGRGYVLQMLFIWFSVHFSVKLNGENRRKINIVGFLVSAWVAFYTIPTYLYYFLALGILAVASSLANLSKIYFLAKCYFGVLILAGLAYLPVLLLNGKANLLSESWQAFAKQEFVKNKYLYFANFGDFWMGIENTYWIFWLIIGLSLVLLGFQKLQKAINKKQNEWVYFIPMPFLALLIMFLQETLIPERVWTALAMSWVMLVVWASHFFKKYASVALALLIFAEIFVLFYQKNGQSENEYTNFVKVYPTIPFRKGEQVFSNDLVYQNLLAFYNLQEKKGLEVDYSFKGKPYTWIIVEKNYNAHLPNGYFLWQETPFVVVFKKLEP